MENLQTLGVGVALGSKLGRKFATNFQGCQACRSVFVKFLVKLDLEFDLKFEISDGKNLVKFWGRTLLPSRKARQISGRISGQISEQISEKLSETLFQIWRLFSETSFSRRVGNFVQQKGGAHQFRRKLRQLRSGNRWCLSLHVFLAIAPRERGCHQSTRGCSRRSHHTADLHSTKTLGQTQIGSPCP